MCVLTKYVPCHMYVGPVHMGIRMEVWWEFKTK